MRPISVILDTNPPPHLFSLFAIFNHIKHRPSIVVPAAKESQVSLFHTWVFEAQSCGDEMRDGWFPVYPQALRSNPPQSS